MTRRSLPIVVGGCVALAVASLVLTVAPAFDPWAWLVWGREVGRLDLDTIGGPSWKPLPVVVTTLLAPLGDAAPTVWLVLVRALGLLAVVGTYRLAARLAGPLAGAVAVALLLLTPDPEARFLRLLLEGHADLLVVTCCVWAIERHAARARSHALVLVTAAALLRPETWPFLLLYAAWLWRNEPRLRRLSAMLLPLVPLLWFGGDWWGSGSPWHGADVAQVVGDDGVATRLGEALRRAGEVVVPAVWAAAAAAVVLATLSGRRGRSAGPGAAEPDVGSAVGRLAAASVAWLALVVAMAGALGYAALGRFLLPAAAALCVLAGVGVAHTARALRAPPRSAWRAAAGVLAAALLIGSAVPRALELDDLARDIGSRGALDRDLERALDVVGREATLACETVAVEVQRSASASRPGLAWRLDIPLRQVRSSLRGDPGVQFVRSGRTLDVRLERRTAAGDGRVQVLGRTDDWSVYAVDCPSALNVER